MNIFKIRYKIYEKDVLVEEGITRISCSKKSCAESRALSYLSIIKYNSDVILVNLEDNQ